MLQEEVAKTGARGVCMGWGLKPGHSREVKKKNTEGNQQPVEQVSVKSQSLGALE